MLMTETNTAAVERKIRFDARVQLEIPAKHLRSFFEHDQWWVEDARSGAQWAVNDTNIGVFDFEQATQGYKDAHYRIVPVRPLLGDAECSR